MKELDKKCTAPHVRNLIKRYSSCGELGKKTALFLM